MEELRRTTTESYGYGASRDGDASADKSHLAPEELADLVMKDQMDAAGFGTEIFDRATGELTDRPTMLTPMDDALRREGELPQ